MLGRGRSAAFVALPIRAIAMTRTWICFMIRRNVKEGGSPVLDQAQQLLSEAHSD
jgi:hypothetical protein